MIRRLVGVWRRWRFAAWSRGQQRRYAARRGLHRPKYLAWLRVRELPGTPKTEIEPEAWIRPASAIHEDEPSVAPEGVS